MTLPGHIQAKAIRQALAAVALLLYLVLPLSAEPTTAQQARQLVKRWLSRELRPLNSTIGRQVKDVQLHPDGAGMPAYFVVNLQPSGFVIVAGDNLVEPIVCFSSGFYDSSPDNPLTALLEGDLRVRVKSVRDRIHPHILTGSVGSTSRAESNALNKWNRVLYAGVTNALQRRADEHKNKTVQGFTKRYNIDKLVYYEVAESIESAILREKQIKAGSRSDKMALVNTMNTEWEDLFDEL